jgi:hypothetical protein
VIFRRFSYRGAFKIKTGGAGHVRENDLSMDKIISTEKGSHKISSQEILVHFPEDKTIEVKKEWQNIRYKMILQQIGGEF